MKTFHRKTFAVVLISATILGVLSYIAYGTTPTFADVTPLSAESVSPYDKAIQTERDIAVNQARSGQYDDALNRLSRLHDHYPEVEGITRDYLAVQSWSGHDDEAVRLYETMPADQPDYVLSAVGHSYRVLKQSDKALAAYRIGQQKYPDSVIFVEGEIRTLADQEKYDEALNHTGHRWDGYTRFADRCAD